MLCQRPASDAAFELTELRPAEDQQRPAHHATRSRASRRSLSVTPRPLRPPRPHHRPHRPHLRPSSSTCPAAPPFTCRSTSRPDQSPSTARRHAPGVLRFLNAHHSTPRLTGGVRPIRPPNHPFPRSVCRLTCSLVRRLARRVSRRRVFLVLARSRSLSRLLSAGRSVRSLRLWPRATCCS